MAYPSHFCNSPQIASLLLFQENISLFQYFFIIKYVIKNQTNRKIPIMKPQKNLSRITIDIPAEEHKMFKAMAAVQGKSMREIVIEAIKNALQEAKSQKIESSGK